MEGTLRFMCLNGQMLKQPLILAKLILVSDEGLTLLTTYLNSDRHSRISVTLTSSFVLLLVMLFDFDDL